MTKSVALNDLLSEEDPRELLKSLSFENGLKLLDELVSKVESGSLALDKAIHSYEKGVLLIEKLREQLSGAEEKLKVLRRNNK